jgi:DNA adenine methylase
MARKKTIRPAVKTHGGKYYLKDFVIESFPENYEEMIYIEPFCGGGSVFLNKKPSHEECINDLDLGVIQIYRALRDEPGEFITRLKRTTYSELAFKRAQNRSEKPFEDYMEQAINEFILRRMSRGGLKKHFAWSTRTRGGQPGDVNAWKTIIEQLPVISDRLEHAIILNKNSVEVIKAFNSPESLAYVDPPYLPETRVSTKAYKHEMNTDDHINLAKALISFEGKVLISGYPSTLYKRLYADWRCKKKKIANHSSQAKKKKYKVECLWMNF